MLWIILHTRSTNYNMGAVDLAQTLKFLPRLFTNVCGKVNEMTEILDPSTSTEAAQQCGGSLALLIPDGSLKIRRFARTERTKSRPPRSDYFPRRTHVSQILSEEEERSPQ